MFTIYKTVNFVNDRFYIGKHKTEDPNDDYLGSGLAIGRAITKYGKENFRKFLLYTYDREEDADKKEKELVSEAKKSPMCYNIANGGKGGHITSFGNCTEARIEGIRRVNKNPTPAMLSARRTSVICDMCGKVCCNKGFLGIHKLRVHDVTPAKKSRTTPLSLVDRLRLLKSL